MHMHDIAGPRFLRQSPAQSRRETNGPGPNHLPRNNGNGRHVTIRFEMVVFQKPAMMLSPPAFRTCPANDQMTGGMPPPLREMEEVTWIIRRLESWPVMC